MKNLIDEIKKKDPEISVDDDTAMIILEISQKIQKEEDAKCGDSELMFLRQNAPSGAHVYLTLWIPPLRNPKEFSCLTLEYDALSGWSVAYYYDWGKSGNFVLRKRHDIKWGNPNMIMTEFGKIYKAYLGKNAINL
jgi:hypothetical protein